MSEALISSVDSVSEANSERPPVELLDWASREAVDPLFIQRCKTILDKMPNNSWDLVPLKLEWDKYFSDNGSRSYDIWGDDVPPERTGLIRFPLVTPQHLCNFDYIQEEFAGRNQKLDDKSAFKIQKLLLKKARRWHEYHIGFLEALNEPDIEQRRNMIGTLNKSLKGFLGSEEQDFMSRRFRDSPEVWSVHNMLNILISSEPTITPVARQRAVELLSSYPISEFKDFFGDIRDSSYTYHYNPWNNVINEKMLRLPRRFWTDQERGQVKHDKWLSNPKIKEVIGIKDDRDLSRYPEELAWPTIVNRLVTTYPGEAVHILMLFMGQVSARQQSFEALLGLSKLDPAHREKVFGKRATYLGLHALPTELGDAVDEAVGGVHGEDAAADYDNLSAAELRQVVRMQQLRIDDLEGIVAELRADQARQFFKDLGDRKTEEVDPKGYFRLLGVRPDFDPVLLEKSIIAQYRILSKEYHPDVNKDPTAQKKMQDLNEAYEVLRDPEKRARYMKAKY